MNDALLIAVQYFAWPAVLPLVCVLPILLVWLLRYTSTLRGKRLSQLASAAMISRLTPVSAMRSRGQTIRFGLALILAAIALSGPRWGIERAVAKQPGIDVVLALDASSSMLAQDERPDRLTAMKEVVAQLRRLSPNDRFALVAFAGRSYVLSPVTVDEAALDLFIGNLDPTVVGQSGSSIAGAIRQSTNLLAISKSDAERAIVVMSDGEVFEPADEIAVEAKRAAALGITVITIGFGTPAGATIPVVVNGMVRPKRNAAGGVVVSRYTPEFLAAAATAGRGVFIPPDNPDRAAAARTSLAKLRTEQRSLSTGDNLALRFQWFLAPALLLLLLDTWLAMKPRRRLPGSSAVTAATGLIALLSAGCNGNAVVERSLTRNYNHATAMLLNSDSTMMSLQIFERVSTKAKSEELRFRSNFNTGFVHLRRGLRLQGDSATLPLDSALAVYKRVLLARPNEADAKWNYELALRQKKSGGGGGGGGADGGGGTGSPNPQPQPANRANEAPRPRPIPGMSEQQADQLLNAMEQEEQDVQGRKQRRSVPLPPPNGRDW